MESVAWSILIVILSSNKFSSVIHTSFKFLLISAVHPMLLLLDQQNYFFIISNAFNNWLKLKFFKIRIFFLIWEYSGLAAAGELYSAFLDFGRNTIRAGLSDCVCVTWWQRNDCDSFTSLQEVSSETGPLLLCQSTTCPEPELILCFDDNLQSDRLLWIFIYDASLWVIPTMWGSFHNERTPTHSLHCF